MKAAAASVLPAEAEWSPYLELNLIYESLRHLQGTGLTAGLQWFCGTVLFADVKFGGSLYGSMKPGSLTIAADTGITRLTGNAEQTSPIGKLKGDADADVWTPEFSFSPFLN